MLVAALAVIVVALISIMIVVILDPFTSLIMLDMIYLCLLGICISDRINKRRKP
jgi:phosphatidylserine synthase